MDIKFFLFLAYGSDSNLVLYFGSAVAILIRNTEHGRAVAIGQDFFSSAAGSHGWAIEFFSGFADAAVSIFCLLRSTPDFFIYFFWLKLDASPESG